MSAFYVDPECADGRRGRTMLGAMTDFGAKTAKTISRLDGGRLERGFRYGWNDGFQGNHKIPRMWQQRRDERSDPSIDPLNLPSLHRQICWNCGVEGHC